MVGSRREVVQEKLWIGWSNELTVIRAVSPQNYPIIGYSKAWSVGTTGPVTGEAVVVKLDPNETTRTTEIKHEKPVEIHTTESNTSRTADTGGAGGPAAARAPGSFPLRLPN